ncbi:hypothetical protein [Pseudoalteromonas 'SMAR']|uniref:hypothetical protein n=1 Tax=Pseudoalteromonas 'SMAR' TaxID=3416908 RepID=UPI003AF318D0
MSYREALKWDPELCIKMVANHVRFCDFNRLFYIGIPPTKLIQSGHGFKRANRDKYIYALKDRYKSELNEGVSEVTLYHLFYSLTNYLKWCDEHHVEAFTQESIEGYFSALLKDVIRGKIKNTTYTRKRSNLFVVFRNHLELPIKWFLGIPTAGKDQLSPFEAYTRSDLNQLLPFLRQLFNQTSEQFLLDPDVHLRGHNTVPTMNFEWKGKVYQLSAGVSKMMCAAAFLMSYYTYSNTGTLLQLRRPTQASTSFGEKWYTMPAFKRRSFKMVHVEIGEHDYLDVPKYCLAFFDRLLEVSRTIDSSKDAPLFQTVAYKKLRPVTNTTLEDFNRRWLQVHFNFVDQTGRRLKPIVSRFRETGSIITQAYQGELARDITLDNNPQTRRRHYSTGNKFSNNAMMQDVASIRQHQAQHRQNAKTAQLNLGIEVLAIEQEQKISLPNLSRTPNGISCANPFGSASELFNRKIRRHGLFKEGEKLACADLLKCFGCPEQVIVQSVSDIWCLLSFKSCIEESQYLHLNNQHFRNNFGPVLEFISAKILPKVKKDILKQAEQKLDMDGPHPMWDDPSSILNLLSNTPPDLELGAIPR